MTNSIPLELHHSIVMLIYICECVQVNIACAFRGGVIASVGVSLLGMTHILWDNISGVRYTPVDDSHSGPEVKESRPVAGIVFFVKTLEKTGFDICLCM